MQYTYFPLSLEQLGATVRYHDLVEGVFRIDDIHVRAQYLNHSVLTLGYRLEADGVSVVYACDHEPYARQLAMGSGEVVGQDRHHADFLADADLVIHDAQYTAEEYANKVGWGHSTVEYVLKICRFARAKRLAITHHDPAREDAALDRIVEAFGNSSMPEMFAAAEGQIIELESETGTSSTAGPEHFPADVPVPPALLNYSVLLGVSDPSIARLISEAVKADNIRVLQAGDAESTLQMFHSEQPSMLVLEQHPPAIDAAEVCRAVRCSDHADAHQVPVVVVASPEDVASCADAGVTDWLVKPFSSVYARTKLQAWLLRTACRWIRAPLPHDEKKRLAALHDLGVLDTAPEDRFDRITRLAAELFDVPIVVVSLVDQDRQWFKSCYGLDARETSREVSFCAHAILGQTAMIVPDTLLDARFADNPLVTGEPRIRFYAGYPLVLADKSCVGTLCIIDTRPRWLDEKKISLLQDLAGLTQQELAAAPSC
jgi:DNA-binding response OmpR family regulator